MKALLMGVGSDARLDTFLRQRSKGSLLSRLITSLEPLPIDEVLVVGRLALKPQFDKWFCEETEHLKPHITLRCNYLTPGYLDLGEMGMLKRVIEQDELQEAMTVLTMDCFLPSRLHSFQKTIRQHPFSPVVGVKRLNGNPSASVGVLGHRNRIMDFSVSEEEQNKECESIGLYYFPPRFLAQGIPVFLKSKDSQNDFPTLERFISWSVKNFKVYAHVFRSNLGF